MMFGDMGHGSVLLIFGLVLVLFNEQIKKTPLKAASELRYLLLLMGFMATYCGFIFNEFFAMPVNIFDSCYWTDDRHRWNPYTR
jgi:V-type H+-transporting ATPase subunit a